MGILMRYILCVVLGENGMDCLVINFVVHVGSSEKEGGFWLSFWTEGTSCFTDEPYTPQRQFVYSPYCSPYNLQDVDKENLLNNQERLCLSSSLFSWP